MDTCFSKGSITAIFLKRGDSLSFHKPSRLRSKSQVDWGDKGSTEAGARLAKAKVNIIVTFKVTFLIWINCIISD